MCCSGVQRAVVGRVPGAGVRSQLSGAERGVAVDGAGLEPAAAGKTAVPWRAAATPMSQSRPYHARYVHRGLSMPVFNLSPTRPQWGAADAEIKVLSAENPEHMRSPFKAWSRSVSSQHVTPTARHFFLADFYLSRLFTFIFCLQKLSEFCLY